MRAGSLAICLSARAEGKAHDLRAEESGAKPQHRQPFPMLTFMVLHFMAKSNQVVPKKGRGRPATGRDPVTAIRLSEELRETVDRWAAKQDDNPGRSEASAGWSRSG